MFRFFNSLAAIMSSCIDRPRPAVLTDTIMLQVVLESDISTLKSLRLVNRSTYNLIAAYEHSVCTNITQRQFSPSIVNRFYPRLSLESSIKSLFLLEHRVQTAQWLSGVALEKYHEDDDCCGYNCYGYNCSCGNIGVTEQRGERVRAHVNIGWSVLWHLTDIAEERGNTHGLKLPESCGQRASRTRGYNSFRALESEILSEQLEFVNSLSFDERADYSLMQFFIGCAFADRVFEDHRPEHHDVDTEFGVPRIGYHELGPGDRFRRRNSWLNWLVLREGPCFFEHAWRSKRGNQECLEHITTQWSTRSQEQLLVEYAAARKVELALWVGEEDDNRPPPQFFTYMDCAPGWKQAAGPYRDIPFFIGHLKPPPEVFSV